MRRIFALLLFASLASSATLTIAPLAIHDCQYGYGTATLTWSGASGPVQIRVLQPAGPALTGLSDPSGSATTGAWVVDGTKFFLLNQAGIVEASATAHVTCGGTANTLDQGLQGGSYFPLQVGNTWVYRYNDRIATGSYFTQSIARTETINGLTYFVMTSGTSVVGKYRGDENGVIWSLTNSGEQVYLDPRLAQQTGYSGPLGTFPDAVTITPRPPGNLEADRVVFVRGIGLANFNATLQTGSSGGFLDGYDLVEARLNGVRLSVPAASLNLSIENTDLDLTGLKVPSCSLPCYFVACGLGGPPPDTAYRPCAQVRLETLASEGSTLLLQLFDSSGAQVFSTTGQTDTNGNSLSYISLPVYLPQAGSNKFTLLPPGNYQLMARTLAGGTVTATAAISVHVR